MSKKPGILQALQGSMCFSTSLAIFAWKYWTHSCSRAQQLDVCVHMHMLSRLRHIHKRREREREDECVHSYIASLIIVQLPPEESMQEDEEEEDEATPDWIPVEVEMVSKIWMPDSEILRLKGFHSLEVLDRLQVRGANVVAFFMQNNSCKSK